MCQHVLFLLSLCLGFECFLKRCKSVWIKFHHTISKPQNRKLRYQTHNFVFLLRALFVNDVKWKVFTFDVWDGALTNSVKNAIRRRFQLYIIVDFKCLSTQEVIPVPVLWRLKKLSLYSFGVHCSKSYS